MWQDKIGLQLYSVRDDLQKDFAGTLKAVSEMGYKAVEFAGLHGHTPEEVRDLCGETGLIPLSAHVPFEALLANPKETIAVYKTIGCSYIAIPSLPQEYRPGADAFEKFIEGAKTIGAEAARQGIILQYHNHDFEFEKIDGEYALDIMYRSVGPEYLQTQIDTCWVRVAGVDPAAYLKKYAGRAPTVHLKDYTGSKTQNMYALIGVDEEKNRQPEGAFEYRPLGRGVQDIPAVIKAAAESGAQWFIVEQDEPNTGFTAMECAKISMDYLKSILP